MKNFKKWTAYLIAVIMLISYGELRNAGLEWWYLLPYIIVILILYDWANLRLGDETWR